LTIRYLAAGATVYGQARPADEGRHPDAAQQTAFEPFRKVHSHADGGHIWVAEETQRGTTICFTPLIAEGIISPDGNGTGKSASEDGHRGG
jgi:hypothetical protein